MPDLYVYTLSYIMIAFCLLYPSTEMVLTGITIKDTFANWLGSESDSFVRYHIRRSTVTLFIHSLIPLGYFEGLFTIGYINLKTFVKYGSFSLFLTFAVILTIIPPLYVLFKVYKWYSSEWSSHPIARNLAVYCNSNTTWTNVASDIDIEYRRVDKVMIDINLVTRIIATDNWVIKVTPYKIQAAHQSDTALVVNRSDTHDMSPTTRGEVQFINIHVKPTRTGGESFDIRLNALDFKNLQDKISRPITVLQNVTFHKTLLDRFIDTFKEQVAQNPPYNTTQELEQCIGCMQVVSNVKLNKLCEDSDLSNRSLGKCTTCFCRPMWCIECMAKWFASRQDENAPETWLSSKCLCPVCRAKFCILDVCSVQRTE